MKRFLPSPKQIQMKGMDELCATSFKECHYSLYYHVHYVQYFGAFWAGLLMITIQLIGFLAGLYGGHLRRSLGT